MSSTSVRKSVQKQFGQRVRLLRLQRKLTQEGLAELSDLHFTYISSVERGKRNISLVNIVRLSHALKITPSTLLQDVV